MSTLLPRQFFQLSPPIWTNIPLPNMRVARKNKVEGAKIDAPAFSNVPSVQQKGRKVLRRLLTFLPDILELTNEVPVTRGRP